NEDQLALERALRLDLKRIHDQLNRIPEALPGLLPAEETGFEKLREIAHFFVEKREDYQVVAQRTIPDQILGNDLQIPEQTVQMKEGKGYMLPDLFFADASQEGSDDSLIHLIDLPLELLGQQHVDLPAIAQVAMEPSPA